MGTPPLLSPAAAAAPLRARTINLSSVDLNLLVALEALLEHRNVTHAANTVGLSQPAMSRSLSRLRGMFNDDLLVRRSSGYVRTVRGEQLHDRLRPTLDAIREIVSSRTAGAEEWRSTIRLAIADHQALILLPPLLDRLSTEAANTEILTEPLMPNILKKLENGELEMAVGQLDGMTTGFYQRTLYTDDYACLLRQDHPALRDGWSAERFYTLRHAMPPGHEGERSPLMSLTDLPARQFCVVSPNTMGAALALLESDMALTVPRRVAAKMATLLPLRIVELPIGLEPYQVKLLWHERTHRNTEHAWVRAQIAAAAHGGASIGTSEPAIESARCQGQNAVADSH
jgi:DNA-binding transcriptional LysR family regulator